VFKAGYWPAYTKFYFQGNGNAYADGGWYTFKKNSKGKYESFATVEAERQEIIAHGKAKLVNGSVHVEFPESFSEFVSDKEEITITVTPHSSAVLYIPERNTQGFTVKCDIGDKNAEFDWVAIGVEKGKEVRPTVPNIEEEDRKMLEEEKARRKRMEEKRARHEKERLERTKARREKMQKERERLEMKRKMEMEKVKAERERMKMERQKRLREMEEREQKMKKERERIKAERERLQKERERLEKMKKETQNRKHINRPAK